MDAIRDHEAELDAEATSESRALLVPVQSPGYCLQVAQAALNLLAHILVGVVVGTAILFCFQEGEMNATRIHIILCVLGYQLLMAEAILSLSPHNSWSRALRRGHRVRAHWLLQLLGAGLATAGSLVKILDKTVHWNSLHGQFALVALVFTGASLVNGVTSLYSVQLRLIPASLSKISHIVFGTVAFGAASISLCYGFDKRFFRKWASSSVTTVLIVFTGILTVIIIGNPLITFVNKTRRVFRR